MVGIDDIVSIGSEAEFSAAALSLFRFQAERCEPYRRYVELLGIDPAKVSRIEDIPFLPIELFKSHNIYCGEGEPKVFKEKYLLSLSKLEPRPWSWYSMEVMPSKRKPSKWYSVIQNARLLSRK